MKRKIILCAGICCALILVAGGRVLLNDRQDKTFQDDIDKDVSTENREDDAGENNDKENAVKENEIKENDLYESGEKNLDSGDLFENNDNSSASGAAISDSEKSSGKVGQGEKEGYIVSEEKQQGEENRPEQNREDSVKENVPELPFVPD